MITITTTIPTAASNLCVATHRSKVAPLTDFPPPSRCRSPMEELQRLSFLCFSNYLFDYPVAGNTFNTLFMYLIFVFYSILSSLSCQRFSAVHCIAVRARAAVRARPLTAQRCRAPATPVHSAPATVSRRCSAPVPPPSAVQSSALQSSALGKDNSATEVELVM